MTIHMAGSAAIGLFVVVQVAFVRALFLNRASDIQPPNVAGWAIRDGLAGIVRRADETKHRVQGWLRNRTAKV